MGRSMWLERSGWFPEGGGFHLGLEGSVVLGEIERKRYSGLSP